MNHYVDLFKTLNKSGIRYVVVGGLAVVLHGVSRFTEDVDLIVHLEKENLAKFADCMVAMGFKPKVPADPKLLFDPEVRRDWHDNRNMKVFSFFHPSHHQRIVDLFITEPIDFKNIYADHIEIRLGDTSVPTASILHLKELKRQANRPVDIADIQSLDNLAKMNEEKFNE